SSPCAITASAATPSLKTTGVSTVFLRAIRRNNAKQDVGKARFSHAPRFDSGTCSLLVSILFQFHGPPQR
ncbi:MAG: hypothetical protein VXB09_12195, partial [Gammaproteobacteria bacterium]